MDDTWILVLAVILLYALFIIELRVGIDAVLVFLLQPQLLSRDRWVGVNGAEVSILLAYRVEVDWVLVRRQLEGVSCLVALPHHITYRERLIRLLVI